MPNDPSETNVLHDAARAGARDGATAAPADTPTGTPTGVGAYHPGAGPLSDTDEISTGAVRDEREPASADGYEDAYDDRDDDYDEDGGVFEWIWDHWYVLLMVAAVALVAVIVAGKTFGGGEEADAPPAPAGTQTETRNVAPETAAPLRASDTGVVFGEPVIRDDTYYLRAGQIAWKGRTQKTDTGTEVTLEGPTAAQFKEAVSIPGGSITTGVFGRAEPGKPILHATFHMTEVDGREYASGTYYAVGSGSVVVEGSYEDTRDGQKVTRVYTEHAPGSTDFERYAVTFEAPEGALVPVLVGWKPPAPVDREAAG